jgi:hypothetical protein
MSEIRAPAPRPCDSCPYRRDVPSGIWDASEYAKLLGYDEPTMLQPPWLFLCHQQDGRVCAGWVGCHGDQLLAIRLAAADRRMSLDTLCTTVNYRSPVPLFASGREAAEHGMAEIESPSLEARKSQSKLLRRRPGAR